MRGNEGDEKKGIADVEPPETFIREANGDDDHEGLTPSSHFSTKESSEMRRLAVTYCYLANQVTVNEMAIDDALAYVKETKGADDSHAMERRNQIMKLVVSINQEKHKRSGALVDLLVHGLCGEEQKLISFLQEELSTTHRSNAKHDNLVEISLQLEEKYTELDKLETQFSDQVQ
ncbi:hypothetical protein PI124_g1378 [Phytophthora idaei]|nr:hypothetical protein PI125_g861 [Phytophthora idaei]KAG3173798.1 hypothetical protein PI126_g618 [Phytophthora idaei]KAG3253985.1 hypothetical protein PI124_g1378 [Phytophthora idaei]